VGQLVTEVNSIANYLNGSDTPNWLKYAKLGASIIAFIGFTYAAGPVVGSIAFGVVSSAIDSFYAAVVNFQNGDIEDGTAGIISGVISLGMLSGIAYAKIDETKGLKGEVDAKGNVKTTIKDMKDAGYELPSEEAINAEKARRDADAVLANESTIQFELDDGGASVELGTVVEGGFEVEDYTISKSQSKALGDAVKSG